MARNCLNGWKWLDMAGNGGKVLEIDGMADMAGNVYKWLQMTEDEWNGWELLEMAEHS